LICSGKIFKVRGNKGEVAIISSPGINLLSPTYRGFVTLKSEKYEKEYKIESIREINGNLLLKFAGIDSMADALRLVGYSVFSPMEADPVVAEGSILGFTVKDIAGQPWGQVTDVQTSGLNRLIEIAGDGEVYLIPFTETIVTKIDRQDRLVIIDPPTGLRELNR
jgi:16S rRNA processing protein RimM